MSLKKIAASMAVYEVNRQKLPSKLVRMDTGRIRNAWRKFDGMVEAGCDIPAHNYKLNYKEII